jgi:hypothetical protein
MGGFMVRPAMQSIVRRRRFAPPHHEGQERYRRSTAMVRLANVSRSAITETK